MPSLQTLAVCDSVAELHLVPGATGLVLFCHAYGDMRNGQRSQQVARRLQHRNLGTMRLDLLNTDEAANPAKVDDSEPLTGRVLQAIDALPPSQRSQPIGLFGPDSGGAAALVADTRSPQGAAAIVSRSGRVELARGAVAEPRAPTLLIVGGADPDAVESNRIAYDRLRCEWRIKIVPRASRPFVDAGVLDRATLSASDRFCTHLRPSH
jgi:putative phosphoribosyl transferase